jgi:3-methylfumaryl-CoA hydratase
MSDIFSAWLGKSECVCDVLEPARCNALLAALGKAPPLSAGDRLPPLYHWLYFWNVVPPSGLGSDGHPAKGGFLPPVPLPRRMWAGGRLNFIEPLHLATTVERKSTILKIEAKSGKSGKLVFVTIEHRVSCNGRDAIIEEQDIVYREAATRGPALPASDVAAPKASYCETIMPDTMLLFRYSALTMNGHRIHYDRPYAMVEEAYPALVVHGPLQATMLADLAARAMDRSLSRFEFTGQAPSFDGVALHICGQANDDSLSLWTEQGGAKTMIATAT